MAKFTKRPKVVDAVQWTGENFEEIRTLVGVTSAICNDGALTILLHRGSMFITKGHVIVKEAKDDEPIILSEFKFNLLYLPKK